MLGSSPTLERRLPFELKENSGVDSLRKLLSGFCGEGFQARTENTPIESTTKTDPVETTTKVVQQRTRVPHHVCTESNTASSSITSSSGEFDTPTKSQPRPASSSSEVFEIEKSVSFSEGASDPEQFDWSVLDDSIITRDGEGRDKWFQIFAIIFVTVLAVLGTFLAVQRLGGDLTFDISHRHVEGVTWQFQQAIETELIGTVQKTVDAKQIVKEVAKEAVGEASGENIRSDVDESMNVDAVFKDYIAEERLSTSEGEAFDISAHDYDAAKYLGIGDNDGDSGNQVGTRQVEL